MTVTGSRARYVQPSAPRFFATFAYAWATISLITATLLTVLAVGLVLGLLRNLGWSAPAQNRLMIAGAVVFAIGSFILARRVVRSLYRQAPRTRNIALMLLGIPAILSMLAWSNPDRYMPALAAVTPSRTP